MLGHTGKIEIVDILKSSHYCNQGKSNCFSISIFNDKGNNIECNLRFTIIQDSKLQMQHCLIMVLIYFDPVGKLEFTHYLFRKTRHFTRKGKGILKHKDIRPWHFKRST